MQRSTITTLCVILICLAAVASAQQPELPTVIGIKATEAITLDGKLDEPVWQQGEWSTDFKILGKPDELAQAQTRFKVAFDDEAIYIGAVLDEPNMDQLKANATEHDLKVHSDDCIEFMIDPQNDRTEYFHFTTNALGTLYDAEMRQGGHVRTIQWDCPWDAKADRQAASWSVEARVPLVYLGLTGKSTGDWALSVTRERQAGTQELSSFVDTLGGFHQPANYAVLKLPGSDFGRYLWQVREPFEASVMPENGTLTYRAKTHITNDTGRFCFISVATSLRAGAGVQTGQRAHNGLDAGQGREFSLTCPVPAQGEQILEMRILDRRNPRRVLAIKSVTLNLTYSPVTIDVTRPCYRQSIYATEKLDAVEADVHLSLTAEELAGAEVRARLTQGEKTIAEGKIVKAEPITNVSVPVGALADGTYALQVSVTGGGQVLHSAETPITKLPPAPNGHEWRLDEDNVLLHNGERYFIYGWFGGQAAELGVPETPYTATQYYSAQWFSVEKVKNDIFGPVREKGSYMTIYPYPNPKMLEAGPSGLPLSPEEADALRERVRALADEPGLWAWYLADEPELRPTLPQRMHDIYKLICEEDPYHPQILLNDTIAGIHKYAGASDIFMPDPYPLFIQGADAATPIGKTSEFMRACREAGKGRKGIMITPQAFNYGDYGRVNNRPPDVVEIRNQAWQAVANGATGFLWYSNTQQPNYPQLGVGVRFVGFEMHDIVDAVFARPVEGIQVTAGEPDEVEASLRMVGDDTYLIVVNTSTQPQQVSVKLPGSAPSRLWVMSEGRSVEVKDNTVSDGFEKYATHIYTSVETLADRAQLSDAIAQAERDTAALHDPNDLAWQGNNIIVEASSMRDDRLQKVLDGAIGGLSWSDSTWNTMPDWLSLTWPAPQKIGRVVVYGGGMADMALQVADPAAEGGWRTIASVDEITEQPVEFTFEPMQITSLRLLMSKLAGEAKNVSISEVNAYAK